LTTETHSRSMSERRNELLSDLVDVTHRVLVDHDIPAEVAALTANAVADRLADHWGGQNISFPKDFFWKLAKEELEIYTAWCEGEGFGDLAKRHKMTERGLRKLIARVRAKVVHNEQQGLFEPRPTR
jgi:Mor family transcriptional regulator